jgi:tetratricopeptide (TPR) repeat protein
MNKLIIALTLLTLNFDLEAKDWKYPVSDITSSHETADKKTSPVINYDVLSSHLNEIGVHAGHYPPNFSNDDERKEVEERLNSVIAATEKLLDESKEERLVFYSAMLNMMGHNLDIPKTGQRADSYFLYLTNKYPKAEYFYTHGAFLGSTVAMKHRAKPLLEKALSLGNDNALYALGAIYLMEGNKKKALGYYQSFYTKNPNNDNVRIIIDAIEHGTINVNEGFIEDYEK